MNLIDYIEKKDGVHYFFHAWKDTINVREFSGEGHVLERNLIKLKAELITELYNEFVLVDKQIVDRGKKTPIYDKNIASISNFIDWAIENKETKPGEVSKNGVVMLRAIKAIISLVSPNTKKKKDLVFLCYMIEKTCLTEFKIED